MNWKDSVFKTIKWKPPKLTVRDDGNLDFTFKMPLTAMFEAQAKKSFLVGVNEAIQFHINHPKDKPITSEDFHTFFTDCGFPEVAEVFSHKADSPKGKVKR